MDPLRVAVAKILQRLCSDTSLVYVFLCSLKGSGVGGTARRICVSRIAEIPTFATFMKKIWRERKVRPACEHSYEMHNRTICLLLQKNNSMPNEASSSWP